MLCTCPSLSIKDILDLGYSNQLLIIKINKDNTRNLPLFYRETIQVLNALPILRQPDQLNIKQIINEPIFLNPDIPTTMDTQNSLLLKAGVTLLRHMLDKDFSYKTVDDTHTKVPNKSKRLLAKEIDEVVRNLPAHWRNTLNSVQGTIEESEALRTIKITVPDLFETNQDSDEINSIEI